VRQLLNHVSGLPDIWDHFHVIDENESQAWAKVKAMPMLAETVTRPQHAAVTAVGGDRAALFIYPDEDLAVVVLTNLMGSSPDQWVDGIAALFRPSSPPVCVSASVASAHERPCGSQSPYIQPPLPGSGNAQYSPGSCQNARRA
jgi:CubicO group peptidase (beta-lactamase class C family)